MTREISKEQLDAYCRCMTQIKDRMKIFDSDVKHFRETGKVYLASSESAFLQLRKCYELVAFASMAGNLKRIEKTWNAFEKEWNLAKILKALERHNPDFLPKPYWYRFENHFPVEVIFPEDLKMTRQSIAAKHGKLNKLLHARNPFNIKIDYQKEIADAIQDKDHLEEQLMGHIATVEKDKELLRVHMTNKDGVVEVERFLAVEDRVKGK